MNMRILSFIVGTLYPCNNYYEECMPLIAYNDGSGTLFRTAMFGISMTRLFGISMTLCLLHKLNNENYHRAFITSRLYTVTRRCKTNKCIFILFL